MCTKHCSSPYEPIHLHAVKYYLFMSISNGMLVMIQFYIGSINASSSNRFCFWNLLQIAIQIPIPCLFCKCSKLFITQLHHEMACSNAVHLTLLQPSRGRSASRSPRSRSASRSRSRSPVMANFLSNRLLCRQEHSC